MGQYLSRRQSDDTLSQFPSIGDSTISLTNDYSRLDDIVIDNYQNKKKSKKCRKLSRLRKSLSNCFRSNFTHLHEIDSDDDNDGIMNVQQPDSARTEEVYGVVNDQDLPRDLREIRVQLTLLMELLNRSDLDNTRTVSCQTSRDDVNTEHLLRQRDNLIIDQQDRLKSLYQEIDSKNKTIERYTKEIAVLKAGQTYQRLDSRNANQLIKYLRDIRKKEQPSPGDLEKVDQVIEQIVALFQPIKSQVERSNVAIINPCANAITSTSIFPDIQSPSLSLNPFLRQIEEKKDCVETKLICFVDHSVTPFISTIPFSSSPITLSHIKDYTKSIIPPNMICRYFFRCNTVNAGQTLEEIYQDTDMVPIQDNKIIVRIRV